MNQDCSSPAFFKPLWIHGSYKANPDLAETQQNILFCVDHVSIKVPLPRLKMLKSKYERNSRNFAFKCFQHLPTSTSKCTYSSLCVPLPRILYPLKVQNQKDLSNTALKPLIESLEAIVGPKFLVSGHTAHPRCTASLHTHLCNAARQNVETEDILLCYW